MYSQFDDPNYVPAPGSRARAQARMLEARAAVLRRQVAEIESQILELEKSPNFFDTPLPI